MSKKDINELFSELIREKMTDKQFWKWADSWYDGAVKDDAEFICDVAENWDEEEKIFTLKEYKIIE